MTNMNEFFIKTYNFIHETQLYAAILLGMLIQYMFSTTKTAKALFVIVTITIFSAWFLVPMAIDILNLFLNGVGIAYQIEHGSRIATGLYATSSLISVELVAILIKVMPKLAQEKINKYLGVKDENYDS